jgi:hypothetical protein
MLHQHMIEHMALMRERERRLEAEAARRLLQSSRIHRHRRRHALEAALGLLRKGRRSAQPHGA